MHTDSTSPENNKKVFEGGDWSKPRRLGVSEYLLILHLAGLVAVDLTLSPLTLLTLALGFWRNGPLKRALRREILQGLPAVDQGEVGGCDGHVRKLLLGILTTRLNQHFESISCSPHF